MKPLQKKQEELEFEHGNHIRSKTNGSGTVKAL